MTYRLFIYIITQLQTNGNVTIVIDGRSVEFCKNPYTNRWIITSLLAISRRKDCKAVKECFSIQSKARFTNDDSCLIQNGNEGITLRQEIPSIKKYLFFRDFIKQFLSDADNWDTIFS